EPKTGAHRLLDAFLVDHRQHARHRGIDQRDMRVGLAAELGRGAGKKLRARGHLGVDLKPDDDLPVAGGATDELLGVCWTGDNVHGTDLQAADTLVYRAMTAYTEYRNFKPD